MNKYHVSMPTTWKGPSKVSIALTVGGTRAMVAFNKRQEDPKAVDYPKKQVWLQPEVALELKVKGFSVRKAKPPKPPTEQKKPKRTEKNS